MPVEPSRSGLSRAEFGGQAGSSEWIWKTIERSRVTARMSFLVFIERGELASPSSSSSFSSSSFKSIQLANYLEQPAFILTAAAATCTWPASPFVLSFARSFILTPMDEWMMLLEPFSSPRSKTEQSGPPPPPLPLPLPTTTAEFERTNQNLSSSHKMPGLASIASPGFA